MRVQHGKKPAMGGGIEEKRALIKHRFLGPATRAIKDEFGKLLSAQRSSLNQDGLGSG